MAYTRGHFSALVAMTTPQPSGAGVHSNMSHENHVTYLPLTDSDGHLLQVHFLTEQEVSQSVKFGPSMFFEIRFNLFSHSAWFRGTSTD